MAFLDKIKFLSSNMNLTNIIQKFNTPVPRYTSYPSAVDWQVNLSDTKFFQVLHLLDKKKPISIYIHILFANNVVYIVDVM